MENPLLLMSGMRVIVFERTLQAIPGADPTEYDNRKNFINGILKNLILNPYLLSATFPEHDLHVWRVQILFEAPPVIAVYTFEEMEIFQP